jgi:hypothetical protein
MFKKPNRKKEIPVIEVNELVACLPGYENVTAGAVVKRLTPKFYHRSGTELRLELEQRTKLITFRHDGSKK